MSTLYTANQIMKMKMKDWPMPLQDYTRIVTCMIGACGDVLYGCAEDWCAVGCPENITDLVIEFLISLRR